MAQTVPRMAVVVCFSIQSAVFLNELESAKADDERTVVMCACIFNEKLPGCIC